MDGSVCQRSSLGGAASIKIALFCEKNDAAGASSDGSPLWIHNVKGSQWHCFLQTVQTSTYVCNAFQNLF